MFTKHSMNIYLSIYTSATGLRPIQETVDHSTISSNIQEAPIIVHLLA